MRALLAGFIALVSIFLFPGCKKNKTFGEEAVLHGTWVKGSNFGDTLWFMNKNGKNILRISTFNPSMPNYEEKEYRFRNGGLEIKSFAPASQEYFPINSFSWTDRGREFKIVNSQLFIFMSSIITYTYRKI